MITVIRTFAFERSLQAALSTHPDAPSMVDFILSEFVDIEFIIATRWDELPATRSDKYRRMLIATYPPDGSNPRFFYSVRARLRPTGDIELEDISIDWEIGQFIADQAADEDPEDD